MNAAIMEQFVIRGLSLFLPTKSSSLMSKEIEIEIGEDEAEEALLCCTEGRVYSRLGEAYVITKFDPHTPWCEEDSATLTLRRINT
jgi:hypothetical protein